MVQDSRIADALAEATTTCGERALQSAAYLGTSPRAAGATVANGGR